MRNRGVIGAVAVFLLVLALGAVFGLLPFATEQRTVITSTPSLNGVFARTTVPLTPTSKVCVAPAWLNAATHQAVLVVFAPKRATALNVVITAPGYRSVSRVPPIYPAGADAVVGAPIPPPRHSTVDASVCVTAPAGGVQLVGTNEARFFTAAKTTVNGTPLPTQSVSLTFAAAKNASLLARFGTLVDHAAAGAGVGWASWLLTILALLVVLAVPAGILAALVLAMRRTPR